MLYRFSAKRYRHLDAEDLELGRLNLLVGPNNAGKSTFIKTIRFAADLLLPRGNGSAFLAALEAQGRGDVLDHASPVPGDVELSWTLSSAPHAAKLTYDLGFKVGRSEDFPSGFYIEQERLRYAQPTKGQEKPFWFFERNAKSPGKVGFSVKDNEGHAKRLSIDVSPQDAVLHQIDELLKNQRFYKDFYPTFEKVTRDVRAYFNGFREHASADIKPSAVVGGARRDVSVKELDREGAQLANVLRYIDEEHGLGAYTQLLGQMLPDLRELKVVSTGDDTHSLRLDLGEGRRFKLSEMSHGTLKAMLLALLVSTPVHMRLLSLDEPELNLHPAWLRILGKWLVECRSTDQLIVSTHSPDLLDAFTEAFRKGEASLFVFNWPRRGVRRVEPEELDEFFEEGWELGDLYRVGEPKLGGWPF